MTQRAQAYHTRAIALLTTLYAGAFVGCHKTGSEPVFQVHPVDDACAVILDAGEPIGRIRLWVPEGIASNTGFSSVYPKGTPWRKTEDNEYQQRWEQDIPPENLFTGGNFVRVDESTLECAGIRTPVDQPVKWTTTVSTSQRRVSFGIRLTNVGDKTIERAGAAVCLKFLDADWWSAERTFVRSEGNIQSLADLGMEAGQPNSFQAYLQCTHEYDNRFYREFWGFNDHRLDYNDIVSEHPSGVYISILAHLAHFMHCNRGNPCTDVMLSFGDVQPGESAESWGSVFVGKGTAAEALDLSNWPVRPAEE